MKTQKTNILAGEICLYGTREAGFGWLAQTNSAETGCSGLLGDGELRYESATAAVFAAHDALRTGLGQWFNRLGSRLMVRTVVRIFAPGGEQMAVAPFSHLPYYGDLQWGPAPVYTISAEAILAAAE